MSDYQFSVISGSKYTRCNRINIDNPLNGIPSILFAEEEVINLGPGTEPTTRLVSNLSASFTDPSIEIPLRNPETWELTGQTISYGALYVALASAYWKLAMERDTEILA